MWDSLNTIPILNGDIITGISLFPLFVSLGHYPGIYHCSAGNTSPSVPVRSAECVAALKQMNPNL